jgi:hypothetical protein
VLQTPAFAGGSVVWIPYPLTTARLFGCAWQRATCPSVVVTDVRSRQGNYSVMWTSGLAKRFFGGIRFHSRRHR